MANEHDPPRSARPPFGGALTAQELKGAIDSGRTGDKVAFSDPGAAPLGTDDEAAGTPDTPERVALSMREELTIGLEINSRTDGTTDSKHRDPWASRPRPRSPNIQIYRPQLTSVLSILNRVTGLILIVFAVALVALLVAAANGPKAYDLAQGAAGSWVGQIVLFGATFAFFLHLSGGIRHLVWDTVHGFDLRSIYISGWLVVAASTGLTLVAWVLSFLMKG